MVSLPRKWATGWGNEAAVMVEGQGETARNHWVHLSQFSCASLTKADGLSEAWLFLWPWRSITIAIKASEPYIVLSTWPEPRYPCIELFTAVALDLEESEITASQCDYD